LYCIFFQGAHQKLLVSLVHTLCWYAHSSQVTLKHHPLPNWVEDVRTDLDQWTHRHTCSMASPSVIQAACTYYELRYL